MLTTKKSREEMFISTSTSQMGRAISLPITKTLRIMYVSELSRGQLVELKSTMLEAILGYEPSYGELAIADELVSDEQVEEEYGGVCFTSDDFWC